MENIQYTTNEDMKKFKKGDHVIFIYRCDSHTGVVVRNYKNKIIIKTGEIDLDLRINTGQLDRYYKCKVDKAIEDLEDDLENYFYDDDWSFYFKKPTDEDKVCEFEKRHMKYLEPMTPKLAKVKKQEKH